MPDEKVYVYNAEAHLDDGSAVLIDLEERGWADKEFLTHVLRWVLVPKAGAVSSSGNPLPYVVVNIPEDAKPVFKSRVYANMAIPEATFRLYGVGYFRRGETHVHWVLPTGDIEVGEHSWLADLYHKGLVERAKQVADAAGG